MMTTPQPISPLRILNQTPSPTRLRFCSDGFPIWDTWVAAGGNVVLPNLNEVSVMVNAAFVDPVTDVNYSVPSKISGKPIRLVAKMSFVSGAGCFTLDQEPLAKAGKIGLLNLACADIHFSLRFLNSPFEMMIVVAPQSEFVLGFNAIEVSATVDGITVASGPIKSWSSDVTIETEYLNGQQFPQMRISAREKNGF